MLIAEYIGNDFPGVSAAQPAQGHNWLDIKRKERGTYPSLDEKTPLVSPTIWLLSLKRRRATTARGRGN